VSWGGGYVTDTAYITGLNAGQAQPLGALAALMCGFSARLARRDEAFAVCDIGCGMGTTALITAAANPAWRVVGLDFNPGQIAAARALAHEAGLENVTFLEADLRDFAETPEARGLEDFDLITAHGVWTWVGEDVQDGIVGLLGQKLKAGGMFHVSYNLLTGWQDALGLQRLVREAGMRLAHRGESQAAAGLKVAQELAEAGGRVSFSGGFGKTMLERMATLPAGYIAHEMLNRHWRPVFHADVAERLADAKLEFCGSARLLTNFPQLTMGEAQRALAEKFDDPAMLELFKDICHAQALRSDIFLRGGRRIDRQARDAMLMDVTLALTAAPENWIFEFETGAGKAQMSEPYYRRVFERLSDGPATVGELLALPDLPGRRDNPAELIAVSIGTEQTVALPNPGVAIDERCAKLNLALLRAQFAGGQGASPIHFALPCTGGGLTLPNFEGMIAHEVAANPETIDPQEMAARLAIQQPAAQRAALAEKLTAFFASDAPWLRHFGFSL
jgi:SAM-dependent methyltransferase